MVHLERRANDLRLKDYSSGGKVLVDCEEQKIVRWVNNGNLYLQPPT